MTMADEMDEDSDERMVEALLLPASYSNASNSYNSFSNTNTNTTPSPTTMTSTSTYAQQQQACTDAPPASLFTTTDPFYLAQAQAAQALSANAGRDFSSFSGGAFSSGSAFNGGGAFTGNGFNGGAFSPNNNDNTFGMTNSAPFAQWGEVPAYQCAAAF